MNDGLDNRRNEESQPPTALRLVEFQGCFFLMDSCSKHATISRHRKDQTDQIQHESLETVTF